jgi:hypothetical protein
MNKFPHGIVYIVNNGKISDDIIQLFDLSAFYEVLGASDDDFENWMEQYGLRHPGQDADGNFLIPDFPILSKVMWMNIDSVRLSGSEVAILIKECERAGRLATGTSQSTLFKDLACLARRAESQGAELEFGHL